MSVVRFPLGLPSSSQLKLSQAQLSGMLEELLAQLLQMQLEVTKASNAPEFAAAVRTVSGTLGKASTGWQAISNTIRVSWGLSDGAAFRSASVTPLGQQSAPASWRSERAERNARRRARR